MAAGRFRLEVQDAELMGVRYIFWLDCFSMHQAAHIRALAAQGVAEVVVVAESGEIPPDRKECGWHRPDFGAARLVAGPDPGSADHLVRGSPSETVHVFNGYRASPVVRAAFRRSLETSARIGLMTEAVDDRGWKGIARLVLWKSDLSRFVGRIDFVLAIGDRAVEWYRRCGFPEPKLFPYGYFIPGPHADPAPPSPATAAGPVELMYLGRCIPCKRVDLLLRALAPLTDLDWTLEIMGGGPTEGRCRSLARRLGLSDRVAFLPMRSNPTAMDHLKAKDLLILPSHHDGWGVVVNEALMRGVPVICSDRCGARDLLRSPWRGEVYPAYAVARLGEALRRWIRHGKKTPERASRIRSWSRRITGEAAAGYFLAVQDHLSGAADRPTPPWYG